MNFPGRPSLTPTIACLASALLLVACGNGGDAGDPVPVDARHEDGRPARIGRLVDGRRTGDWVEFHPDGRVHSRGTYDDGLLVHMDVLDEGGRLAIRFRRETDGHGRPVTRLAVYEDSSLLGAFDTTGAIEGDIGKAMRRAQAVATADALERMRLAAVPFDPVALVRSAWKILSGQATR